MLKFVLLAAAITAAAPRDWSQTVASTPVGWRAGNPSAPLKLVEYGSLNCPHCAHFARETDPSIMAGVRTGRVSFEYRPYLIFPHDVAATLVARCVPLSRRFAFVHDYYAQSAAMTERLRAAMNKPEQDAALKAAARQGMGAFNAKVMAITGMGQLAARYGLPPAAANRCVSDKSGLDWLQRTQAAAKASGINGTPTYLLNGDKLDLGNPEELLAKLR